MRWLVIPLLLVLADVAAAQSLIAARTVRANSVLTADDIAISEKPMAGAATDPAEVIGLETAVALYKGLPIRPDKLRPPAAVERNQMVTLLYRAGTLSIVAEGRTLDRGAAGDVIRVMNSASRLTLFGTVLPDGTVMVSQ